MMDSVLTADERAAGHLQPALFANYFAEPSLGTSKNLAGTPQLSLPLDYYPPTELYVIPVENDIPLAAGDVDAAAQLVLFVDCEVRHG